MALYLVVALVVGLAVGSVPLPAILYGRSALRAALREADKSRRIPPDPDDLHPNELALLSGGPVRVGETAIMDAFLDDRIRRQSAGGFLTLVGRLRPYPHEKDLVRKGLVSAFRNRVGVGAREILRKVVAGRGVERLRTDLAASGLIVDSPALRRALGRRARTPGTIRGCGRSPCWSPPAARACSSSWSPAPPPSPSSSEGWPARPPWWPRRRC